MPFNIGALSWLGDLQKGAMAGQRAVDQHQLAQYQAALRGLAVQQAQQQQQALPGVYRVEKALSQMGDAPMQPQSDAGGVGGFLQPPVGTQQLDQPQPSGYPQGIPPSLATPALPRLGTAPMPQLASAAPFPTQGNAVRDPSAPIPMQGGTPGPGGIYQPTGDKQDVTISNGRLNPQAVDSAHRQLDMSLDQQGTKMIQSGVPGPEVQDTTKLGMMAGRQIDPMQWGRATRKQIVDAIEKTSAGESDTVKALTFLQLNKLMAPEEKMQAQMWARDNQQNIQLAIADLRARVAERGQDMATYRALQGGEEKGWQIMPTGDPENPFVRAQAGTGKVEPMQLPAGTTRMGSAGAAGNRPWSKDAMDSLVEQSLQGDPAVMSRLPRSGPARQQYEEAYAERLKQMQGGIEGGTAQVSMNRLRIAEAKSAATTAGRMTVQSDFYANEAKMAADQVIEASKAVPRTEIKPINQLILAYETNTGSPQVIALGQSLNNLRNVYGKMSNPTGTGIHDADKQHFENILGASLSQGQLEAGIQQLLIEGTNMTKAAFKTQQEVLSGLLPVTPPGGQHGAGSASVGQQNIIERGGKRWRVIGGDPNDPDVEEVK